MIRSRIWKIVRTDQIDCMSKLQATSYTSRGRGADSDGEAFPGIGQGNEGVERTGHGGCPGVLMRVPPLSPMSCIAGSLTTMR